MFGRLRDTLANTSPSLSYRRSMIPSRFFPQQQHQQNHKKKDLCSSSNDDDDETDDESNDNSFYHNPYHSSGQMNYVDVPQQQYINEHTYPTYLARQQTSDTSNRSLDEQIQEKLLLLQQRGNQLQFSPHRQHDYAYRNQTLPKSYPSFVPDINKVKDDTNEEEEEKHADNDDEIRVYYPGNYPNQDEQFDFASVVLWYRNVMQSVKKFM
jgi:hypothetical protein